MKLLRHLLKTSKSKRPNSLFRRLILSGLIPKYTEFLEESTIEIMDIA